MTEEVEAKEDITTEAMITETTEITETTTIETEETIEITETEMVVTKTSVVKIKDKDTKRRTPKEMIEWINKIPPRTLEVERERIEIDHQEKSLKLPISIWVNNLKRTSKLSFQLKSITNILMSKKTKKRMIKRRKRSQEDTISVFIESLQKIMERKKQ